MGSENVTQTLNMRLQKDYHCLSSKAVIFSVVLALQTTNMFPMEKILYSVDHETGYFASFLSQTFRSSMGCTRVTLTAQAEIMLQRCC